jgi:tyrosyl-tRNA synthetase
MAKKATQAEIENILGRGVADVVGRDRLIEALKNGTTLRFKMGMDPTSPDIHIGHAVGLRVLRKLQDLGHEIVVIIGDYTARIGDPSGRSKTRPPLDPSAIEKNAATYLAQVGKILDKKKIELRKNSEWLAKLSFADIIKLATNFTVARTLERDDFAKRYKEGTEIYLHELLYPLMQAYDSVAIKASVEMGGTDQTFNMLAGRELQKKLNLPEQAVISVPLLVGLDGVNKMSKSLGNYIGVTEPAESIYGKVMSIPDALIMSYFELATELALNEIAAIKEEWEAGANPRDLKMRLAREIAAIYTSEKEATKAEEAFVKQFQKKEVPEEVPVKEFSAGQMSLAEIVRALGFASSKTEARRVIEQGGVEVDGNKITDPNHVIIIGSKDFTDFLVKKGSRCYAKVHSIKMSSQ